MTRREIKSEVTGTVSTIATQQGATVSKGDSLIVLESMKMEITVAAPNDGKIADICVNVEEFVEEGRILIVLEV